LRDPMMGLGAVGPVIDDDLLEGQPVDAVAAGAAAGIDLLVGSNADEMALYSVVLGEALGLPQPDEDALHAAVARLHDDPAAVIAAYRTAGRGTTAAEVHDAVRTDWMFGVPTRRLADAHTGRTWRYVFGWRSPGWEGRLGACHGLELPFVFDVIGRVDTGAFVTVDTEETRALAGRMRSTWVAFARDGDPGWPAYTAGAPITQRFDTTDELTDTPDGPEQAVWDGVR
ncbi:MAG TPA: carboxylesterase family protein, partial [Actinomycetospora sp.]|nr:carboxylesterase family protein [Actinomycetospora sp.]